MRGKEEEREEKGEGEIRTKEGGWNREAENREQQEKGGDRTDKRGEKREKWGRREGKKKEDEKRGQGGCKMGSLGEREKGEGGE